jgi:hypothetical protein
VDSCSISMPVVSVYFQVLFYDGLVFFYWLLCNACELVFALKSRWRFCYVLVLLL